MFLDWEIIPLLGQMEWKLSLKNLVKGLDFQVYKALPIVFTTATNKSTIQESQTNININKKQNKALKERAMAKTRKP